MTGRPGYRTMEMNGGSSAPYLACTPCVPLFVHCLIRVEAEGFLDYQGRAGIISIVRWNLRPVIFGVDSRLRISMEIVSGKKKLREKKRHININFLLWLTSRWPWDKRLVVPGLTGPKSLCVRLETQEI